MNNDITQISDSDLQTLFLNTTLQGEVIKSNIAVLASEILKRQALAEQAKQSAAQQIVLPQLKKIQLPTLPPINNETK